jgi:hypothetical protein
MSHLGLINPMLLIPSAPCFSVQCGSIEALHTVSLAPPTPQPLGEIFESRQKDFFGQIIHHYSMYTGPPVIHYYTQTLCTNANVSSFATITYNFNCIIINCIVCQFALRFYMTL